MFLFFRRCKNSRIKLVIPIRMLKIFYKKSDGSDFECHAKQFANELLLRYFIGKKSAKAYL